MQFTKVRAEKREARGSRAAQRLRRAGKLPAVIYGHGETPENVALSSHDLAGLLQHGQHLVELDLDGRPRQVLIKDVQFDHMASTPVHVDFVRVDMNERVTVTVPLEFKGTPVGTNEGGLFETSLADLEVECAVTDIPESIRVSVADLKLGDALHVRDLQLPPNMTAATPAETIVCVVRAKAAEAEAAGAEEGAEQQPEIISRREKEEGEGEQKK